MNIAKIDIVLNGIAEKVPANSSIDTIIELFKEGDPDLIVELNGRFVYPQRYASTTVSDM